MTADVVFLVLGLFIAGYGVVADAPTPTKYTVFFAGAVVTVMAAVRSYRDREQIARKLGFTSRKAEAAHQIAQEVDQRTAPRVLTNEQMLDVAERVLGTSVRILLAGDFEDPEVELYGRHFRNAFQAAKIDVQVFPSGATMATAEGSLNRPPPGVWLSGANKDHSAIVAEALTAGGVAFQVRDFDFADLTILAIGPRPIG